MKKLITSALVITVLFSLLIPSNYNLVLAAGDDGGQETQNDYQFNVDGDFVYHISAPKATTSIRYRTVGMVVHMQSRSNYDPLGGGRSTYRILPYYVDGNNPYAGQPVDDVLENQIPGDVVYNAGVECEDDRSDPTNVDVKCTVDKEIMKQVASDLWGEDMGSGVTMWFSNILQATDSKGKFPTVNWNTFDINSTASINQFYWRLDTIRNPSFSDTGGSFSWSTATYNALPNFYNHSDVYRTTVRVYRVVMKDGSTWEKPPGYRPSNDAYVTVNQILNMPGVLHAEAMSVDSTTCPSCTIDPSLASKKLFRSWVGVKATFAASNTYGGSAYTYKHSYYTDDPTFAPKIDSTVTTRSLQTGLRDLFVVGFYDGPPPVGGTPEFKCTAPAKVSTTTSPASYMQSNNSGVLLADARGASKFDVSKGIPSTENLYANIITKPELMNYKFSKYTGSCSWDVVTTKQYALKWTTRDYAGTVCDARDANGNCTASHAVYNNNNHDDVADSVNTITVKRDYSFWAVDDFAIYKLTGADVKSAVISGGQVKLTPSGLSTTVTMDVEPVLLNHIKGINLERLTLPAGSKGSYTVSPKPTVTAGDSSAEAKTAAEDAIPELDVKNDKLVINGSTIMDNNWVKKTTSNPASVTEKPLIGNNVLYRTGLSIPLSTKDGVHPTQGSVTYTKVISLNSASATVNQAVTINDVTVRTPVVNYSSITASNEPYDQTWGTVPSPYVGVLGRNLVVDFDNSGQHLNILGYGNKDYTDYTGTKRVRFSFPVFVGTTYYDANDWIDVGATGVTVKVAEWATEGVHTVRTESWAKNAQDYSYCGTNYNGTLGMECAVNTYDVTLVGRVSGFSVYDIGDFRFESVFRNPVGTTNWSGFKFWSGLRDKDGNTHSASSKPQLALPIRPGSHPAQVATTPHNGYPFLFYFDTIGEYWKGNAGVKIIPTFTFVPKNGGAPVSVDLYYNSSAAKMIKVGGPQDTGFSRNVKLADPLRAVSSTLRQEALEFEYDHLATSAAKGSMTKSQYVSKYSGRTTKIATGYKDMTLNYTMRTLVGSYNSSIGVSSDTQKSAVQRWFGEYSLPIDPYIIASGTNLEQLARTKYKGSLTGKEPEFMKGGYIIVNFQVYPYKNGTPNAPSIAYNASSKGNANMWNIEKQVQSSTSYLGANFTYKFGDIIMFESDFSVKDDYK